MNTPEASAKSLFEEEIRPLLKLLSLIKVLVGMCIACLAFVVGGAIWVSNQANAIAANSRDVRSIVEDRKNSLKEWTEWKRSKDENDTKIFAILEAQQNIINQQQRFLERLDARIK